MNTLIGGGVVLAIAAFAIWLAMRQARSAGAADQAANDMAAGRDAEDAMHEIQAETRDTPETVKRLDRGTF